MEMRGTRTVTLLAAGACAALVALAQSITGAQLDEIARQARSIESRVIEWRRDIHVPPELSRQEIRTARMVAVLALWRRHFHRRGCRT